MADQAQNYSNHRRFIPGFHFLLGAILVANFIWSVVHLIKTGLTFETARLVVMGWAFLEIFWYMRQFATGNQDRIIRLEMTVRLKEMLPGDLKGRIGEFTTGQLIGLRFASDAELPGLARKVLADRVASREVIKQQVQTWVADRQRV